MGMQKKRLAFIGVGAFFAVIILLLIIPSFIDWGKYQSLAKDKLREATGYEMNISGAFRIGLVPRPHVSARDLVLTKPSANQGADPFLVLAGADVNLELLPLLSGKISVASIHLDEPRVTLVTYKDGKDNFQLQAEQKETDEEDIAEEQKNETKATDKQRQFAVHAFRVDDGLLVIRDEVKKNSHEIGIKELNLKADGLFGPFDGEGNITYGKADFDVEVTTGGYRAGETLPVQLNIEDKAGRADVKWSGIVALQPKLEVQGEMSVSYTDLDAVMQDVGLDVSVPRLAEKTNLSGMLTYKPTSLSITNGALTLDKTKISAKVEVDGLATDNMKVKAALDTRDIIVLEPLMKKTAPKKSAENGSKETTNDQKTSVNTPTFLPSVMTLPTNLIVDVSLRAAGVQYKGQKTGALNGNAKYNDNTGDVRVNISDIPGGGDVSVSGQLSGEKSEKNPGALLNPKLSGSVIGNADSLKFIAVDWLDVTDEKTMAQPGVPSKMDVALEYAVSQKSAKATFKTLSFGETKLNGDLTYKIAARSTLGVKLKGNIFTLPDGQEPEKVSKGTDKKDKSETQPMAKIDSDFEIALPQLPFDVDFDLSMGRLNRGSMVLNDLIAQGSYDGKELRLTRASAALKGGTISAEGAIADIEKLSGINMKAGLKTSDLENFYTAMTGEKLPLEQTIGAFAGQAQVKGGKDKADVALSAVARGFTIQASGTLDDPLSGEIPGTLKISVKHSNAIEAMQVFSPGFGNNQKSSGKPIDITANVGLSGQVYRLSNIDGKFGSSDFTGTLKADMSGKIPAFTAELTSKKLALGEFAGVDSQTPSGSSSDGGSSGAVPSSGTGSKWSRAVMDTSFLNAAEMDFKLKAKSLSYGTWLLNDADLGVMLKDGALNIKPLRAGLYGGTFDGVVRAQSQGDKKPLDILFDAETKNVDINRFMQSLTSSSKKKASGIGSVTVSIKGSGATSAALMGSLSGNVDIATQKLTIEGMDLDKLAANTVEAFDGGWRGVLAGVSSQGFKGGSTAFKDSDHSFPIADGVMTVKDFKMETTSENALMVSNGDVNFGRWTMDVNSAVQVTQPKDVPVIGMRLYGSISAPQKSINSKALDNLLRDKIGDEVQDLITDKLGDSEVGKAIGNLLGVTPKEAAPTTPVITPETAPAAPVAPEVAPTPSPEEQLIRGLFDRLGG